MQDVTAVGDPVSPPKNWLGPRLMTLGSHRGVTLAAAAVGGMLTDTAFPQRGWWPMAAVGMALLVLALRRDSARWAALVGLVWGLGFFLPHIFWAYEAVGPVPWVALSLMEAGIVAATCAAWAWIRRGALLRRGLLRQAPAFGAVWVIGEQLRQVWPFGGFPWGRLAFSQTDSPLLPLASWGGAPLVSGVVAALGVLLVVLLRAAVHRRARQGVLAASAVAAVFLLGVAIPLSTAATDGELRVAAVQGNVAEPGLGAFANARQVLGNHVAGTEAVVAELAGAPLDLVLWPENSSDINPRADADARALIEDAVAASGVPLLFGTDRFEDGPDGPARYNDMVLWLPGQGPVSAYSKQIPAAFAEYIPMRQVARLFSPAVDLVQVDMARGTEIATIDVPTATGPVTVATVICFEVAYDALIREAVLGGAQVLVVPTNNASFGYTAESEQQLAMSRFRAVEHGRATVQISTVGVSGIISPDGRVLDRTALFTADAMVAALPLRSEITVSDRLGDVPVVATTVAVALLLAGGVLSHRRVSRATRNHT